MEGQQHCQQERGEMKCFHRVPSRKGKGAEEGRQGGRDRRWRGQEESGKELTETLGMDAAVAGQM